VAQERAVGRSGYSAEVRRLLAVVPDTVAGRRDRAILLTLVLTGRRRAEVIGLRAGDLSIEGETVFYAYRGKGGKRGRRELPHPAYEVICATLEDAPRVVMETLGHSQISLTLNTYSHVIPALGRAAAEQMDGILGARSGGSATG